MKRHGNLHTNICSIENLILADRNARIGKKDSYGVKYFDKRTGCNFLTLHNMLMDEALASKISEYDIKRIIQL